MPEADSPHLLACIAYRNAMRGARRYLTVRKTHNILLELIRISIQDAHLRDVKNRVTASGARPARQVVKGLVSQVITGSLPTPSQSLTDVDAAEACCVASASLGDQCVVVLQASRVTSFLSGNRLPAAPSTGPAVIWTRDSTTGAQRLDWVADGVAIEYIK